MNALEKLRSIVTEIEQGQDPLKKVDNWALAGRLLSRMPTDQDEVKRVVRDCDLPGLDALVRALETPGEQEEQPAVEVEAAVMDAALKAFKKRLKLARLADESKLGGHYTTSGRRSSIDAIVAPTEFDASVWQALVRAGKLRDTGQGFYALPEDAKH